MIKKTLKGVMWWLSGDTDNGRHKVWCNNMNSFKEVDMTEKRKALSVDEYTETLPPEERVNFLQNLHRDSQFVQKVVQNNVETNKDLVKLIANINVIHDVYDKQIEELKQRVRSLEKKLNKIDGWDD